MPHRHLSFAPMHKKELCQEIGRRLGRQPREVAPVIEVFMATVGRALARGEEVHLRGFGTFTSVLRKPRRVKPPGKPIMHMPAARVPCFRPHKDLARFTRALQRKDLEP